MTSDSNYVTSYVIELVVSKEMMLRDRIGSFKGDDFDRCQICDL